MIEYMFDLQREEQMGTLSKDTLQRILILYLISKFPNGVFSSFRFQKVLYFAEKDLPLRPFTFKHTEHGQYSFDAREVLDELTGMNYISREQLSGQNDGIKWKLSSNRDANDYATILDAISKNIRPIVDNAVKTYGYLGQAELDHTAHSDPVLSLVGMYEIIFAENIPDVLNVDVGEEECESWELALNPNFIKAMGYIVDVLENADFSLEDVEKVDTL